MALSQRLIPNRYWPKRSLPEEAISEAPARIMTLFTDAFKVISGALT